MRFFYAIAAFLIWCIAVAAYFEGVGALEEAVILTLGASCLRFYEASRRAS